MATRKSAARLHLLTVREVQTAGDGDNTDGGGLVLRVRGDSCAWVFRYTAPSGRRREMGLGVCRRGSAQQAGASLIGARDDAHRARDQLRQGVDPLQDKEARREAAREAEATAKAEKARERWTLARWARQYHERVIEPSRTAKHSAQWISSLENHMPAALWHKAIAEIEAPALLQALAGITAHERARNHKGDAVPETLQRIRQRLDAVFEDATFHKRCTSNPAAAIRRKMREAMPKKQAGKLLALPYREAPALLARLRDAEGIAARCLEFAVLTAARTTETLLVTWAELDLDACTWLVPAERMKAKEAHLVHLSPRAVEVLEGQRGMDKTLVFPSPLLNGKPMSNMAMLTVLGRLGVRDRTTVHGLCRATFSTWANETGAGRPDVIEACLAHEEKNRVRAAYNRALFNDERRILLEAWSEFLAKPQVSNVLPLKAA